MRPTPASGTMTPPTVRTSPLAEHLVLLLVSSHQVHGIGSKSLAFRGKI